MRLQIFISTFNIGMTYSNWPRYQQAIKKDVKIWSFHDGNGEIL